MPIFTFTVHILVYVYNILSTVVLEVGMYEKGCSTLNDKYTCPVFKNCRILVTVDENYDTITNKISDRKCMTSISTKIQFWKVRSANKNVD